MKNSRIKKKSIRTFILLLALTLGLSGCRIKEGPNHDSSNVSQVGEDFDRYCEELAKQIIEDSPLNATFKYSDLESLGLEDLLYQLDDASEEALKEEIHQAKEVLEYLGNIEKDSLDPGQKITYDMLVFQNQAIVDGEEFIYYFNVFQPSSGVHINFPLSLMQIELETEKEVEAYIERVAQIPRLFQQLVDYENNRAKQGIMLPANVYKIVIEQIDQMLVEPDDFMMYLSFCDHLAQLQEIGDSKKSEYKTQFLNMIQEQIYPSFRQMKTSLIEIQKLSQNQRGLPEWPKGHEYYNYLVRTRTSYDMDAEDLRKWAEVQLSAASIKIQGYLANHKELVTDQDINNLLPKVETKEDFHKIREQFLKEAFKEYGVKKASENIIPEYLETYLPPAFYFPISIDGEDYGNMYMTKEAYRNISLDTLETDIHENIPGHHFYFSILYGSELPLIRKVYDFLAYTEGWAQYVQGKTYEYSAMDKEVGIFWKNIIQMNAAYQVLIDIQVNYDGMSKQEAIKLLLDMGYDQASAETTYHRMIANPGEMIHYYYGIYMIETYLERYKKQQGKNFDIKEFHDIILTNAELPFIVMDQVLKENK